MKKQLFFTLICILGIVQFTFSQYANIECANPDYVPIGDTQNYSFSTDPTIYQEADPIVFNVYYWQIRKPDGSYDANFTEEKLLESIAELNIKFNDLNIFFKYRGYDGFNSPTGIIEEIWNPATTSCDELGPDSDGWGKISRCQRGDMWNYATAQGYYKPDMINIYVPYQITDVGGAATGINKILVSINKLTKPILYHELGHIFGLSHTNIGWTADANTTSNNYPCVGCEHTTRIINNPDYNANCRGDRIHDTNAVPDFYREHLQELLDEGHSLEDALEVFIPFKYVNTEGCFYTGTGMDCIDEEYDILPDDVRNIMLNASPCEDRVFSPGQGVRMREYIENTPALLDIQTDVPSLYEPYVGVYDASVLVNTNPPKFQPGFDYSFLSCYPDGEYPQPADYYVSFSYLEGGLWWYGFNKDISIDYYNTIIHKDRFAIRIAQLEQQPRKCWNTGTGASSGVLVKFNDGVLNTNVTITQQDSSVVNNPDYIDNLQPGLYNVIKNYNSGETQENVILKNNN